MHIFDNTISVIPLISHTYVQLPATAQGFDIVLFARSCHTSNSHKYAFSYAITGNGFRSAHTNKICVVGLQDELNIKKILINQQQAIYYFSTLVPNENNY